MRSAPEAETVPVGNFLFVGEHTALDFANTFLMNDGGPFETLFSYQNIVQWLVLAGLISGNEQKRLTEDLASPSKQRAVLEQIRAFRGQWKDILERLTTGKAVSREFIELINLFLEEDLSWQTLRPAEEGRAFQVGRDHVLLEPAKKIPALIAATIAQFLASANFQYLRRCAGPDCVIYFYDTTKSHRRQWCSMAICGNRHKVAKFRAKNGEH